VFPWIHSWWLYPYFACITWLVAKWWYKQGTHTLFLVCDWCICLFMSRTDACSWFLCIPLSSSKNWGWCRGLAAVLILCLPCSSLQDGGAWFDSVVLLSRLNSKDVLPVLVFLVCWWLTQCSLSMNELGFTVERLYMVGPCFFGRQLHLSLWWLTVCVCCMHTAMWAGCVCV
jgi:hypothetical protein